MRGNARTAHINVRMTPEERAAILTRSSRFGMAPSTFMRESALLRDVDPVRVADTEELRAIHTNLKRIGSNLNQAVRALNAGAPASAPPPELAEAVSQVSRACSSLAALLAVSLERTSL